MALISDLARKPTSYKVVVFAAVGAVMGLMYWQFMLNPMRKEKNELEVNKQSLEGESQKIARDIVEYKKLVERSDELKKLIEENQRALPTGAELPAFFETLNRKIGEAGVEVKKWEYKKEIAVETFFKVPLEIEVSGTFHQLKRFFASLVQRESSEPGITDRDRIISIENLQLTVPKSPSRDLTLTAKFTASTFRQAETAPEPVKPAAKPAARPAAKPATKPAAPTPAPGAAPSATPAGAKAATDAALKAKADATSKGAAGGAK